MHGRRRPLRSLVVTTALVPALALSAAAPVGAADVGAAAAALPDAPDPRTDPGAAAWERVPRERVAEECGMDPDLLEQADLLLQPRAYTVVRHGKLCWEARNTDETYHVASITKTMGGLLTGAAVSRSSLSDEDRLDRWVDLGGWPLVNPDATLAHALSMTAFNPTLAYPLKKWMYDTLGDREIDTLMEAIDAVIAEEPAAFPGVSDRVAFAQQELFDRLGMVGTDWQGETFGFSMNSTPRDLARLGLLIARRGAYGGEQLIDREYMHRMTHPTFEDANTGYGYLTYLNADLGWMYSTGTNDAVCSPVSVWDHHPHRPFHEAEDDHGGAATRGEQRHDVGAVWASGAGGQRIAVHRGLDLVMTIRDEATNEGHKSVWNAIRPALVAEDPVYEGDEAAFCEDYRDGRYAPQLLPDLAVATPTVAVAGDQVRVSAVVSNPGEQVARDVAVRFLVDGAPVGADQVLEEAPVGTGVVVTSPAWTAPAGGAVHTVQVQVDPGDRVPELDLSPNGRSMTFSSPADGASVERYAGAGRVETAVAVSGAGREQADTVVIARADDPADALVGAPLAAHLDAPLLLTARDGLSPATAAEIRRLGATTAVLLGGPGAVGDGVVRDLEHVDVGIHRIRRIAGENRWATAAAVAGELPVRGEVFVARGDAGGFADAISVSGLAASLRQPILLTDPRQLPDETADALRSTTQVVVIGGTAAVGAEVEAQLRDHAAGVRRLAGPDRYATSAAVAGEAIDRGTDPRTTWVATGVDFPDGLVAGPAAARHEALLVLIDGRDLQGSSATRELLVRHTPATVRISGGAAAVSDRARSQLEAIVR